MRQRPRLPAPVCTAVQPEKTKCRPIGFKSDPVFFKVLSPMPPDGTEKNRKSTRRSAVLIDRGLPDYSIVFLYLCSYFHGKVTEFHINPKKTCKF